MLPPTPHRAGTLPRFCRHPVKIHILPAPDQGRDGRRLPVLTASWRRPLPRHGLWGLTGLQTGSMLLWGTATSSYAARASQAIRASNSAGLT